MEGEELESPTKGEGTPESFNEINGNKPNLFKKGETNFKMEEKKEALFSLNFSENTINLLNGHEIHDAKDTSPVLKKTKAEWEEVKKGIEYNTKEEHLDVVKSEEGKFYSIRWAKSLVMTPILKKAWSLSINFEGSETEKSNVNFDLNENEIRDFKRNDKVNWPLQRTKLSYKNAKKNPKKRKGKGK